MSSLIQPAAQGPAASGATPPLRSAARSATVQQNPVAPADEPVSLDTLASAPPPEVLAQIQNASASYEALQAQGFELHYEQDPGSTHVSVELRDSEGAQVRTLSPSEAIELAVGPPLTPNEATALAAGAPRRQG